MMNHTKTMLRPFSRKITFFILLAVFAISACKKDNSLADKIIDKPKDVQLYNTLVKSGVKEENIKDIGEYYLVEGDMLFKKHKTDLKKVNVYFRNANENFDELISQQNNVGKGKIASSNIPNKISQWSTNNIVSSLNVENIKIYYDSYSNPNGAPWSSAWQAAANNWENIPNCKISFYNDFNNRWTHQYTDNAIIIVEGVPLNPNAYAYAEFPSSDNAGYTIHINTSVNLTEGQKTFILTHELGHCLGFRHTNWQSDWNEYNAAEGAVQIAGTPATDPNSIMNNGASFPSVPNWSSFSTYDIIAAQTLYPYNFYDKWINDVNSFAGYGDSDLPPAINWDTNLVSSSTISLEVYQYGISKGVIASNIPNSGSYTMAYNYRYYLQQSTHDYFNVQIKIISDANPSISDMTKAFNFYWD